MIETVLHLIVKDGWSLGADTLESIYVANNITNPLDSCKPILGMTKKISRPKKIMNLGFKAKPLYCI